MKKTAVIVDSSSYINNLDLQKYHIYKIDDPVIFGQKVYHESDWPDNADFYRQMREASVQPTTSQPSLADVEKTIQQVIDDGFQQAIIITISSGFSGTYQTAFSAAEKFADKLKIVAWDSKIACAGAGNQALMAARSAQAGVDFQTILDRLKEQRSTTDVFFVVDSIKHLQRTGRLSGGQALIAGLLSIKPILRIDTNKEGKIDAIAKERKMSGAWRYIAEHFDPVVKEYRQRGLKLRVSVVDANNPELSAEWMEKCKRQWPELVVERGIIGPLIGVHTGEKAVGFIWSADYDRYFDKTDKGDGDKDVKKYSNHNR